MWSTCGMMCLCMGHHFNGMGGKGVFSMHYENGNFKFSARQDPED